MTCHYIIGSPVLVVTARLPDGTQYQWSFALPSPRDCVGASYSMALRIDPVDGMCRDGASWAPGITDSTPATLHPETP